MKMNRHISLNIVGMAWRGVTSKAGGPDVDDDANAILWIGMPSLYMAWHGVLVGDIVWSIFNDR